MNKDRHNKSRRMFPSPWFMAECRSRPALAVTGSRNGASTQPIVNLPLTPTARQEKATPEQGSVSTRERVVG
jgi:hypothetical protein